MMLQCATCSNVTVWTQLCMAPMTQFHIWLRSWQTKGHTARNSINQYVTDRHSQVQGEGQVLLPSSGSRRLPPTVTQLSD